MSSQTSLILIIISTALVNNVVLISFWESAPSLGSPSR